MKNAKSARILVIDDETLFLGFMNHILESNGYSVTNAESGEEGMTQFNQHFFDLVITDFRMPTISGYDVAVHIRNSERCDTPIICVTGEGCIEKREVFNKILLKPIKIKDMLKAVNDLC
ncbi:MAG: response regulator [Desulfobacterales bacterium]